MDGQAMAERKGWRLSLVIPAYNEEAGIAAAIAEADAALAALAADYEVLVVDDGSRDATFAAAAEAARSHPRVRVLRHSENRGYGAALRTGFEAARFDQVAFTDADCQFYLDDLALLLPLAEQFPVVAGRRLRRQDPWRRRLYSRGYNLLVRALLGTRVSDCDCALKVFRRDALARLLPESRGFFVNAEMLARARQDGLDVAEVGVRHRPRLRGQSTVSLADIPRTLRTLLPFWWSRVLFSAPNPRRRPETLDLGFGLLIAVAALLFFGHFRCPLQEPQEARYAEIPRQMLAEGRLVVPVLHGQPYLDKPPLFYWLVMGSYRLFGVRDWAARLVPCAAGFLCVLITYGWGKRVAGKRAALAGALVLCLSARFVQLGRLLVMDGVLCLEIVAGWAAAHLALREGRLRVGWWLVSGLASGLGLLTKGPVGVVLIALPAAAYQFLDSRAARVGWRFWVGYLGTAAIVAGPWYGLIARHDPRFAGYFFWDHNFRRFVEPFDHARPGWFYLPALMLGMLPWTLLLPGLAAWLSSHPREKRPAALGFFLLAFAWSLSFYSLAGCKRAYYILPAMPPLALAIGCYLDAELSRAGQRWATPRRWTASWTWCAAGTFAVLLLGAHQWLPDYARRFSLRGQVRRLANDKTTARLPVLCYPHRWDSVSFYLQRNDVQVVTPDRWEHLLAELRRQPEVLVFVKSEKWLDELRRQLPPSLEFVPHQRQGFVTVGRVRRRDAHP